MAISGDDGGDCHGNDDDDGDDDDGDVAVFESRDDDIFERRLQDVST